MPTFQHKIWPFFFAVDAETAHNVALALLKWNLVPGGREGSNDLLRTNVLGMEFHSPIGLAAGFDKNAVAISNLSRLGFGFVEVGTVTPKPQPGNPRPRLFRLSEDRAIINRLGFNNKGLEFLSRALEKAKSDGLRCPVGVNIGKNRETENAVSDYVIGFRKVRDLADYVVVNISSPNTPGLRELQTKSNLKELLDSVMNERALSHLHRPVFVKVAPDLSFKEISDVGLVANDLGVDGLIATNTTTSRPDYLKGKRKDEDGGLSGAPLKEASTRTLKLLYQSTEGKIPIIGVGGVLTGTDAYQKIRSGASLIQIYSAMIYRGPYVAQKIAAELSGLLSEDGFANVSEAVGADVKLT